QRSILQHYLLQAISLTPFSQRTPISDALSLRSPINTVSPQPFFSIENTYECAKRRDGYRKAVFHTPCPRLIETPRKGRPRPRCVPPSRNPSPRRGPPQLPGIGLEGQVPATDRVPLCPNCLGPHPPTHTDCPARPVPKGERLDRPTHEQIAAIKKMGRATRKEAVAKALPSTPRRASKAKPQAQDERGPTVFPLPDRHNQEEREETVYTSAWFEVAPPPPPFGPSGRTRRKVSGVIF
ncbi:hypothetical protein QBC37DRAFT_102635, partial [Rhypophila decipiens]